MLSAGALAAVFATLPLRAQKRDSVRAGVARGDSALATPHVKREAGGPPVSPRRAFVYSLLIPGLGQSALDRRLTGATFFLVEGLSLALLHRSQDDLRIARAFQGDSVPLTYQVDPTTGIGVRDAKGDPVVASWQPTRYTGDLVRARALHVEDWVAIVIFNHLFAGADAFVAAHLWDLPARVSIQTSPVARSAGLTTSISFR